MLAFDRAVLDADLPLRTGMDLGKEARQGLASLLDRIEQDAGIAQLRDCAYFLATIRWETGETFRPVRERRARRDRSPAAWRAQSRYWDSGYFGRGYVQITWERNYRSAGAKLAGLAVARAGAQPLVLTPEALVEDPDLALEEPVAYAIAARGMREGWFTGRRLGQYIADGTAPDYLNARRIINGLDQAERIAGYANGFELLLRAAAR
jgi:predicted chitinase